MNNSNKNSFFTPEILGAIIAAATAIIGLIWAIFAQSNDSEPLNYRAPDYLE